jgi:hypothetical protein
MTRAKLTIFLCWHSFYWCITGGNDTDDAYIVDVFDSGEAYITSISDTGEVSNLFDLFLNSIDTVQTDLFYTELILYRIIYTQLILFQAYCVPNLFYTNLILYQTCVVLTFFIPNLFVLTYIMPNLFYT